SQPVTGIRAVSCHLDNIDANLGQADPKDVAASARAKLGIAIGKARVKVSAVGSATGKKVKKAVKNAKSALAAITKTAKGLRKKHQLSDAFLAQLQSDLAAAGGSLSNATALLTPL